MIETTTTKPPTGVFDPEALRTLASELVTATSVLEAAEDRVKSLRECIAAVLSAAGPGAYAAGDFTVKARTNNRVNKTRLAERFPITERPDLWVTRTVSEVDTKRARVLLTDDELASVTDCGALVVTVS